MVPVFLSGMSFRFTENEREEALKAYLEFLRHKSVSATGDGIRETAEFLKRIMIHLGIDANIEETKGHPVVSGSVFNGSKKTLIVYNHYDVQPVDPLNEWEHPPFSAQVVSERVYARGASDNKGTLMARLFGFEKVFSEKKLDINLKFLFEGEEEIGSPNLEAYIRQRKDVLSADAVIMEGAGLDDKGRPQVVLGVKGLVYMQLETVTGVRDLHSSNAPIAYNAAWELVKALNTLVDPQGRVAVKGFYDDVAPLPDDTKMLLQNYETTPEQLAKALGTNRLRYSTIEELREALFTQPTCTIDGIWSGYQGIGSKTIVPCKAAAKLDFRLVPNQNPEKIFELVKCHLKEVGFQGKVTAYGLEHPVRTSPNTSVARAMVESARRIYSKEPAVLPNSAGTQPMGIFTNLLGIKEAVSAIGVGSTSSNVHAPNENVAIEDFFKGMAHSAEFFYTYAKT
jgi:acetylornithine deacetylase/succinyl-diaminopimelate desuccinylase-like protein